MRGQEGAGSKWTRGRDIRFPVDRFFLYTDAVVSILATALAADVAHVDAKIMSRMEHCNTDPDKCITLPQLLLYKAPGFAAYVLTFWMVTQFWRIHAVSLANVTWMSTFTLYMNVMWLFPAVSLLPIATVLTVHYWNDPAAPVAYFLVSAMADVGLHLHNVSLLASPGGGLQLRAARVLQLPLTDPFTSEAGKTQCGIRAVTAALAAGRLSFVRMVWKLLAAGVCTAIALAGPCPLISVGAFLLLTLPAEKVAAAITAMPCCRRMDLPMMTGALLAFDQTAERLYRPPPPHMLRTEPVVSSQRKWSAESDAEGATACLAAAAEAAAGTGEGATTTPLLAPAAMPPSPLRTGFSDEEAGSGSVLLRPPLIPPLSSNLYETKSPALRDSHTGEPFLPAATVRQAGTGSTFQRDRIEAYSDGVFSIVSTLVILAVQPPEMNFDGRKDPETLFDYFRDHGAGLQTSVIAFLYLSFVWIVLSAVLRLLPQGVEVDRPLFLSSVMVLTTCGLLPFAFGAVGQSTRMLAMHKGNDVFTNNVETALLVLAALAGLLVVAFSWMVWLVLRRRRAHFADDPDAREVAKATRTELFRIWWRIGLLGGGGLACSVLVLAGAVTAGSTTAVMWTFVGLSVLEMFTSSCGPYCWGAWQVRRHLHKERLRWEQHQRQRRMRFSQQRLAGRPPLPSSGGSSIRRSTSLQA